MAWNSIINSRSGSGYFTHQVSNIITFKYSWNYTVDSIVEDEAIISFNYTCSFIPHTSNSIDFSVKFAHYNDGINNIDSTSKSYSDYDTFTVNKEVVLGTFTQQIQMLPVGQILYKDFVMDYDVEVWNGSDRTYINDIGEQTVPIWLGMTQCYITGSGSNFTDDEIPVLKYNLYPLDMERYPNVTINDVATDITKIEACLSYDGYNIYNFPLTDEERMNLRDGFTSGLTSKKIYYYIKITGGTNYNYGLYRYAATITLVDNEPVIQNISVKDIDTASLAMTSSEATLVRHVSNAQYEIVASGTKGATIVSYSIECGSKKIEKELSAAEAAENVNLIDVINDIDSNTFMAVVKNSRGSTARLSVTIDNYIPYIYPTCNLSAKATSGIGKIEVAINGKWYPSTFNGITNNNLAVICQYKNSSDADWITIEIPSENLTIDNDTYKAHYSITGLNYQDLYDVRAGVIDDLVKVETGENGYIFTNAQTIKAISVFDWSENDFNINGILKLQGESVERGTWTPVGNFTNDVDYNNRYYGTYIKFGQYCIISFFVAAFYGEAATATNDYLTISGLPYPPSDESSWYSGGGTCSGYHTKNSLEWFSGWCIQNDKIYGRTTGPEYNWEVSNENSMSGFETWSSGYIMKRLSAVDAASMLYASGTIMYKIADA